ncbi:TVP38/TMEM64 family protein [bacterium]|jgi:uncharacterized membrane protein YdjX (TVP38/TMEM64 family)|nr:TVP38/TMEM64 family protein [bacterium]
MSHAKKEEATQRPNKSSILKLGILVSVVVVVAVVYSQFQDVLSLDYLASKEGQLRAYQDNHAILGALLSFLIYVAVTGLSLPGAAVLTLGLGWLLGFSKGLIVVSFASTTGATLAFLFSRFLLRETVMGKFGDRLKTFNDALEREGPFYLFTLRLIPVVPFFVINLVMGLTPIRTTTYWWVSQLGMIPATAVYVYAGSTFPSLSAIAENGVGGILKPQLIVAFALLGLFPIIVKKGLALTRRKAKA